MREVFIGAALLVLAACQSIKSMEKIAAVMAKTGAELWINHDKAQSDSTAKAPAYID
jgi:hypothetical protein